MTILAFLLALLPAKAGVPLSQFGTQLQARVADSPGTGIIVGILDHGHLTIYKAGSAGDGRAIDEHTLFEIGSVTKTFTATMLAQMALQHRVSLDDPVAKYLPASVHVPSKDGKTITLLNLAEQRSGLPRLPSNFDPPYPDDPYESYGTEKLYAFLNSYVLPRDPGSKWEYSNLGFGLLGQALANHDGRSYEEMLRARILEPLRMSETAIALNAYQQSKFAVGHDGDGNAVHPWDFEALAGAGAIRSSLYDMLKYLRCNMGEGPLASVCLFAQQPRAAMPGGRIGLAWWTSAPQQIVNHGGDTAGYHTMIAISADHSRGVVVLTNGGDSSVEGVGLHALDPDLPMPKYDVAHVAPAQLDAYTGYYVDKDAPQIGFTVKHEGVKLMVQITGQQFARIYPSADKDEFFYHVVAARIDFQRDASGKVVALTLFQNSAEVLAFKPGTDTAAVKPIATPTPAPSIELGEAVLDDYVGTYNAMAGTFTVTRTGEQLMVQLTGQPSYPVFASAKDHFYYKVVDAQIEFIRDQSGKVTSLVLHQNGMDMPATKQ